MPPKRVGILTGGGDAPGLNAVIRASVKSALKLGWQVTGIRQGFAGLLKPGLTQNLGSEDVMNILHLGGTILGTSNRDNPFAYPVKEKNRWAVKDYSGEVLRNFRALRLDALIAIGGDGTMAIAFELFKRGLPVVGVPKTIDNDVVGTVITFGFDTAVSTATEAIDRLHSTAQSHRRVMVVEVMGRNSGWIALHSGISGGADAILIPEIPFKLDVLCDEVEKRYARRGPQYGMIVAAEGAFPLRGHVRTIKTRERGRQLPTLGGIADYLARQIHKKTKRECRSIVLGHLQRGGMPTTFDRLLSTRFGSAAVRLIQDGKFGHMVASRPPKITSIAMSRVIGRVKRVPLNSDIIRSARNLDISFGDR